MLEGLLGVSASKVKITSSGLSFKISNCKNKKFIIVYSDNKKQKKYENI